MAKSKILNKSIIHAETGATININISNEVYSSITTEDVYNHNVNIQQVFDICGIEHSNCSIEHFNEETLIVWPVKVRNAITIIHLAQIETLRYLQKKCSINICIIVSGQLIENSIEKQERMKFGKDLKKVLDKKGCSYTLKHSIDYFKIIEIKEAYLDLLKHFSINDISLFKIKNYRNKEEKLNKLLKSKIIDSTDVLFNYALIGHYHKENNIKKSIILAGVDEYQAWTNIIENYHTDDKYHIGGLFIPRLKIKNYDFDHSLAKSMPKEILIKLMFGKESGKWLVQMFFLLSFFSHDLNINDLIQNNNTSDLDLDLESDTLIDDFIKIINQNKFISMIKR